MAASPQRHGGTVSLRPWLTLPLTSLCVKTIFSSKVPSRALLELARRMVPPLICTLCGQARYPDRGIIHLTQLGTQDRSIHRFALRLLSGLSSQHQRFFCGYPEVTRSFQWSPDVRVLRTAVERNQPHAMRALSLIALLQPLRPFTENLAAV